MDYVWQMWAVLAGVVAMIALYAWDRLPMEVVSAGVIAVLLLFFQLFPLTGAEAELGARDLLSGFANPALITIMALLVVGQAMFHTGAMEGPARRLGPFSTRRPRIFLGLTFLTVFVVSAFMNNTPLVVMFIPILSAVAGRLERSPSLVMMPLSFVCILAGMTTLIGSSTNLLVADALQQQTGERLGFFAPTLPGLAIAAPGLLYVALFMRRFLPDRGVLRDGASSGGRQFIVQIELTQDHPLIGKSPVAGMFPDLPDMTVRMVQRGARTILPPFDAVTLEPGDALIVAATRKSLSDLLASRGDFLQGMLDAQSAAHLDQTERSTLSIVEAVVAPGSRITGRTIDQSGFRQQSGLKVLGVQRRSRMTRGQLDDVRLEAGDVLLLFGSVDRMTNLRTQRDVLLLEWSATDLPDIRRAFVARAIFGGLVLTAASGLLPILHAAMLAAMAMLASGCINPRQAARAFDLRIFLLIGAAFALGESMQATGAAGFLADVVVGGFAPLGPAVLVSALFLFVAVMTNIISNSATAVLFAPIAVAAAERVDLDPAVLILTVIFAANCSFATPMAYQTNLLVMGPGHYRFSDYMRAGAPLVILLWLVYSAFAPWYFQL